MTLSPVELLKQLGAGVRPDGSARSHATTPIDSASFGDMLDRVHNGQVSSDRAITIASNVSKDLSLTDEQLARVATATDAAEAAGANRIMAVVGGQALLVDVLTRTIEKATPVSQANLTTGVDGVVFVPDDPAADLTPLFSGGPAGSSAKPQGLLAGLANTANHSVAALLASLGGTKDESGASSVKPAA